MSQYSNRSLPVGTYLAGTVSSYRVIKVLGQGGFGITYLVEDAAGRHHAVKEFFLKDFCERVPGDTVMTYSPVSADIVENQQRAFRSEARRLMNLPTDVPGFVHVNDVFSANSTEYFVMEYVDGINLKEYVTLHGPLTPQKTIMIMRRVIEAVAFLHDNKITHLDIKPANIMIRTASDGTPRPVLIDFGLSKHYTDSGEATSTLTNGGFSPGYAPIEQYAGITKFSPTVDVYSLAATAMFCLTGRTPSPAFEITGEEIYDVFTPLPYNWSSTLTQSMKMAAQERPSDAGSMLHLIDSQEPNYSKETTPAHASQSKRKSSLFIIILTIIIVGIAIIVVLALSNSPHKYEAMAPVEDPSTETVNVYRPAEEAATDQMPAEEEAPAADAPAEEDLSRTSSHEMYRFNMDGYFTDGNNRWPVKLKFSTDDNGQWGDCTYTNVNYGTTINMRAWGRDGDYTFEAPDGSLTIHISGGGEGVWDGYATSGSKRLSVIMYE